MPDARKVRDWDEVVVRTAASVSVGEIFQLNGEAAYMDEPEAQSSGTDADFKTSGKVTVTKSTATQFLDGGRVYWDHSANNATYKPVNDRDFYIGRAVGDWAAADAQMVVDLNKDPPYNIDLHKTAFLSVPTGTQAVGAFGFPKVLGGAQSIVLTATNEAQCIDLFSVDRFAVAANAIAEVIIRLGANGSTSAVDLTIGMANGTSTTDADAITEAAFFHVDGGALDIFAESDDGTTEVNATDTTVDITEGSAVANRFEFWLDARNPADVRYYINGAEVLNGTANLGNINVAVGPLGLLIHLEKTSGTATAGPVYIDEARVRYMEQALNGT